MYNNLKRIENILKNADSYRIEIINKDKTYLLKKDKIEEPEHNTNAIGFEIRSRNDYEEE